MSTTIRALSFKRIIVILMSINHFFLFAGSIQAGPLEDCSEYTKYGVPGQEGDLLCRKGYLLSHNKENKTPYSVIEHLTDEKAIRIC